MWIGNAEMLSVEKPDVSISKNGAIQCIVTADSDWVAPEIWERHDQQRFPQTRTLRQQREQACTPAYRGARLLEEYLMKVTGAHLPLVAETDWEKSGRPPALVVGQTRFNKRALGAELQATNLPRDGYRMKTVPGRLMIAGATSWGAFAGCAAFLEDDCGVEWFWPTALGEEVTPTPLLTFRRLDRTFSPAIVLMLSGADEQEWGRRIGLRDAQYAIGHNLGPDIYYAGRKSHPEWFPLIDGKREIPGESPSANVFGWQPCMASPAAIERAVGAAREFFIKNPAAPNFPMGTNDAVWRGCECRYCQAQDGPTDPLFATTPVHYNGRYSRRHYHLLSCVADAIQNEFPGKKVAGWAYAGTDLPPIGMRPNPKVLILVVGTKLAWLNPELRHWEELRMERWSQMAASLMFHDYFYQTGYIPIYTPHLHAEAARVMQRYHVTSGSAEAYAAVGRSGPKYWLQTKMCLDPSQNPDALLDRWFKGMFQEAAAPVRRYFDIIEQCWKDYPYHAYHTDSWSTYCFSLEGANLPVLTPTAIEQMNTALREAQATATKAIIKKRVAVLQDLHEGTRLAADILWRQRPYIDPVPFDDNVLLQDVADYAQGVPGFDGKAYYQRLLKTWSECEPLVFHVGMDLSNKGKGIPLEGSASELRLARALNGLVLPALNAALADGSQPETVVRQAIAQRVTNLAGRAPLSSELRRYIEKMTARTLRVPRCATPVLDSKPSDECWRSVSEQGDFVRVLPEAEAGKYPTANLTPSYQTTFRICHDNRSWRLLVACHRPKLGAHAKANDDRIEIVLNRWPNREPNTGGAARLTVTVTADGQVTEDSAGYGVKYWKAGARAAVVSNDEGYVVELSIPFRSALFSPASGKIMEFNVRRVVGGADGETSAWAAPGNTFLWMDRVDTASLLETPAASNVRFIDEETAFLVNADHFSAYQLESPAETKWPSATGQPTIVRGGRSVLIGKDFFNVQPGLQGLVEVTFKGRGKCRPGMTWYRCLAQGMADLLNPAADEGEPQQTTEHGRTVVRVPVTVPAEAQAARVKVLTEGDVQVQQVRWQPRRPVELAVQIVTDTPQLAPGHAIDVHARIVNTSGKPLENLRLRLVSLSGVDLRSQAVAAPGHLDPGATARALWWLVPVYAVGEADFVFVLEANGIAPQVIKVRGPK
ncbi:MAG: DUF4838 domain-containing protein [Verrucomicrobia bacterium]|nr:DUF4838 domain-containing protein [Verrucomicrobiota bacterium]